MAEIMIENIIQTENGYRATVDGVELSIPDAPGNRHWQMVQDAIADGATVTVEEPPPPPVPNLSFPQLLIGLVTEGWITEAEGEAWLAGTVPAAATALIDTLPAEQRFAAKARAVRPSVVVRTDPLVNALGAAQGKTAEQLDAFFTTYAQV